MQSDRRLTEQYPVNFALPTRAAFRAQFQPEEFKFDLAGLDVPPGEGGSVQALGAAQLPSLTGEKVAMPCGINLPHVHPRATEILFVVDAAPEGVLMAFVEENVAMQGPRAITNTVTTGQATFFPQGLVHMQVNMGCTPATMIAALGSDDFGVQTITTTAIAGLAYDENLKEGTAAAFGISQDQLIHLVEGFPGNPAAGAEECRKRCNIY
ncbi:cupin-like protein [Tribonema minus]|uniref:Cupin-like protein n=1 Tax=Tribonema minus TaxID=303371 RepID=A0A836CGM4_9STRA|nr:cupin-like protein [Tribonema minus]